MDIASFPQPRNKCPRRSMKLPLSPGDKPCLQGSGADSSLEPQTPAFGFMMALPTSSLRPPRWADSPRTSSGCSKCRGERLGHSPSGEKITALVSCYRLEKSLIRISAVFKTRSKQSRSPVSPRKFSIQIREHSVLQHLACSNCGKPCGGKQFPGSGFHWQVVTPPSTNEHILVANFSDLPDGCTGHTPAEAQGH